MLSFNFCFNFLNVGGLFYHFYHIYNEYDILEMNKYYFKILIHLIILCLSYSYYYYNILMATLRNTRLNNEYLQMNLKYLMHIYYQLNQNKDLQKKNDDLQNKLEINKKKGISFYRYSMRKKREQIKNLQESNRINLQQNQQLKNITANKSRRIVELECENVKLRKQLKRKRNEEIHKNKRPRRSVRISNPPERFTITH